MKNLIAYYLKNFKKYIIKLKLKIKCFILNNKLKIINNLNETKNVVNYLSKNYFKNN